MYIIVRGDLKPGEQLAQACHAAFKFTVKFENLTADWMEKSNYLVIVSVKDEFEINKLLKKADEQYIKHISFEEPDYNNSITAVVLEPGDKSKRLCSSYPLALKEKKCHVENEQTRASEINNRKCEKEASLENFSGKIFKFLWRITKRVFK